VWVPTRSTADSIGTLTESFDGNYTYTFRRDVTAIKGILDAYTYTGNNLRADLGDPTFQPTLTHRMLLFVGGNARGTGTNTSDGSTAATAATPVLKPLNAVYDFIPATGNPVTSSDTQRQIVNVSTCFTCHATFDAIHGGARQDTQFCIACHNDQMKYGKTEATIDPVAKTITNGGKVQGFSTGELVRFIHMIHMGEGMPFVNDFHGYGDVKYPQDQRNCVKCHTGTAIAASANNAAIPATPQGDNWKNVPSRLACGGCHTDINFQTGLNHGSGLNGGPRPTTPSAPAATVRRASTWSTRPSWPRTPTTAT